VEYELASSVNFVVRLVASRLHLRGRWSVSRSRWTSDLDSGRMEFEAVKYGAACRAVRCESGWTTVRASVVFSFRDPRLRWGG